MLSFFDKRVWLNLFLFLVLGCLIYSNTLEAPFYFDDLPNIVQNPHIRLTELTLEDLTRAGFKSHSSSRPIANITFALNYYLQQYDVTGYHVINIIIHLLTGIFLYFFIRITLHLSIPESPNPSIISFFAALLWLVHPIQTQSVTYIVQRMNSIAAMFYILSLLLYVYGRLARQNRIMWPYFGGCVVAGVLAMGCKQIAATLPFFLLLYEWYFFQDLKMAWFKRFVAYSAGAVVLLGILAFLYMGSHPWKDLFFSPAHLDYTAADRALTQFRVVIYYISLLIYPHPSRLNLDYDFAVSRSLIDPMTTLFSLVVIISLIGLACYLAKKERLVSFGLLWFFGNLVIESSVTSLEMVYEHRTYLPSMLFFLMIVVFAYKRVPRQWAIAGILGAVILVFCFWTYERNGVWRDPVLLWKDCAEKSPRKARPHNNLGIALARQGRLGEAIEQYRWALQLKPDYEMAHVSLGSALIKQGKLDAAISHYFQALQIEPKGAVAQAAHLSLGIAYTRQGKLDDAVFHYNKALELKPDYAEAHNGLGAVLARQGKLDVAIRHYSEALKLKPDYAKARVNLRNALARQGKVEEVRVQSSDAGRRKAGGAEEHNSLGIALAEKGKLDEAIVQFSEALHIRPEYAEAHYNMGVVLVGQGRLDEAVRHYSEALRIKPDYADAHNNLGIALARQGKLNEALVHFSEALRIRPDFAEAKNNLRRASRQAQKP